MRWQLRGSNGKAYRMNRSMRRGNVGISGSGKRRDSKADIAFVSFCARAASGGEQHSKNQACSCNHCGAERCETQTGKCSCKQNVEGENCDHCVNNAWGFHYCQGCQMCNCAPASMSRQCDPQTGQCPCHSGASGIFCDKCAEGYWNYSLSGCQKCDCESDLAMGTICDTATGQCHCMEGATGIRCENCLPGYVVIPHHGCQVCDECVLGLVEDMRQTARTFDEMEFDMQNVTIEQVFSQRLNRLQSSTNSLQVIGTHFDFKARKRVFPQQYVHYMKSLIAERTNDVGPFTVPHNKHLDEVTVKADSSSRNRDKLTETWLKEASDFLTGIKATTMEESAKSLMISAEETESITSEVQEFENSLADLHNHTASLMERGSTMIISIRDLQSNLNRSRAKIPDSNTSKIEKTLSEAYEGMNSAQEIITGTVDLGRASKKYWDNLNLQLDIHAEDLVQQFSGSTENVSEAVEASSAYRQVVEVLNSTKETLSEIQITLDDKLSVRFFYVLQGRFGHCMSFKLAALKPLLQDLGDMVNASLNEMRIATGIRSDITNRVRKELSSQEEVISNFRTQLNAAIDILKEMKKGADVYERIVLVHLMHIEQVSVVVPEVLGNVSSLRQAFVKSVTAMNAAETGITLLREKIARARNLANMVKLGVRFYLNSSLELYKGDLLKKVEAQTDISLFFRTQYPDGLLFFLGNQENPAIRANDVLMDYLALEVKDGRARCIFDLGAGDASVTSNRVVSDNRWHKASVERVGKLLTLKVSTEGEPDDQTEIFSHGSKSILNLNKNYSKLFIGGVPTSFELPKTIVNHRFNGQIEGLVLHGEPKGLWNFALDGRNNTFGAPERRELHSEASLNGCSCNSGIHLNGKGYAVLQRLMWNPRQHIDLVFYFKTYASEGLMFYAGKDRDVLAVELKRGHVRLYLNLGSGGALLTTPRKYNDGNYHRVQVKREGKHAILSVNLADTVEGYSPGGLNHLDVTDTFYVGGVPYEVLPAKSPLSRHGFHGCIERMHVNGHNVNLNRYVEGYFVEPGCPERVNSLWVALNEGNILMKSRSAGVDTDYVTVNVKNFSDGDWHHLSVSKSGEQMLNFATAERSGEYISFDVCPDELFPSLDDNFLALENLTEPGNVSSIPGAAAGGGKESSCALRLKPVRHTPCGGNCYRFGVEKNSRLEFEALSSPIDSKSEISLELRTNAHSGFVLFAWNQKMDYLALYLKDGRLIFEFDSGSGPAVLQSKSDIFDYQWHYVKLIRRGRDGTLWLDDVFQAEGKSNGLASRIELKRPFYVGGLPDDTYRLAQRQRTNFQSIAAVFSGCLRNLLLNGNPLGDISNSVGVYPCDNSEERGLYFGEQPGYFFLEHKFQVNKMFSLDLQVKPRINDGILFVIATPSGSEIITSQLNEGDLLVSLEQNGSKPQQLRMKMKPKNLTCDGHWHTIRLLKVNNFLTVGFDGSNAHTQLKKTTSFANGEKFNLYLGGIPESFVAKGLLSKGNDWLRQTARLRLMANESRLGYFVGCMRDISLDPTNGKQRTYTDFKEIPLFGSASVDGCPLD
ncbi:hypothetical protein M513_08456 [Trichuris suis]|uniref:Laminin G domain protein n=1 Tax=Trichuris suis TaxID=68888 RepID=A0A085M0A3_9BILA|nr:hypothetical protein M513_08456 [Trichuris suis]